LISAAFNLGKQQQICIMLMGLVFPVFRLLLLLLLL